MKLQVIGLERKTGTYENKETGKVYDFDNYNFHCVGRHMSVLGNCVREVKLKVTDAAGLIADIGGDINQIIGHTVDFDFGAYGKVTNYELVQ